MNCKRITDYDGSTYSDDDEDDGDDDATEIVLNFTALSTRYSLLYS